MIDRKALKEYQRMQRKMGNKCNLPDLLAEDKNTDPYNLSPRFEKIAKWALHHWHRLGYISGVHNRRMHYALADMVKAFNGKPYRNIRTFANQLGNGLLWARYLEWIEKGAIVDRKNPEAHIFTEHSFEGPGFSLKARLLEPEWYEDEEEIELPDFPAMPSLEVYGNADLRPYHIEVWAEKSTMNDILVPLCEDLQVNLQTFSGDASLTRVENYLERAVFSKRPTRIFYISDFDKHGFNMPLAVARKIQFINDRDELDLEVRLIPIVLTPEQIDQFKLPSAPDSNTVELDAQEALHPGELVQIVTEAVLPYRDKKYETRAKRNRTIFTKKMRLAEKGVTSQFTDRWEKVEKEYKRWLARVEDDFDEILRKRAKIVDEIEKDLKEAAKGIKEMAFDVDPRITESGGELFDSARDYFDQNDYYQERKAEKLQHFPKKKKS